jgi:neutral ceramidase
MNDPTLRNDGPHHDRSGPSKGRRRLQRLVVALITSLFVVGPWPVDDSGYLGSEYARRTIDRLDASPVSSPAGPIRVGLAEVDLTPGSPRPLAGFIGQVRTPFSGVDTPCFARALTVESASGPVTILTADLLLINARMARAVVDRAGVRADQVYFTASHTHGGPGGWGDHPLEMLVAGAYDPAYFESLVDQLADAVRRSRTRTEPAELGFVQVEAPGRQKNRVDPALPTHDTLSALVFRPIGAAPGTAPIAVLAVFGAHATVSHPIPPRLGGDYPSALASELKRVTGARSVLFASGAVGDASPARPRADSSSRSAEALGIALAGDLLAALPSARFAREVEVASLRLDVDLPVVRLPFFSPWLRFGPALTWWIADRKTHLHALRLGPAVLVGFPGDYSGHLADLLAGSTRGSGLSSVATSFDGDFRGYLVSEPVFRLRGCYETRWMSFYGPWAGEYLNDLARRMVDRLSTGSPPTVRAGSGLVDPGPRIALATLLAAVLAVGWRRRREVRAVRDRAGFVAVAVASAAVLAFLFEPEGVAWSRVGIPLGLRLAGFPVGVLALARAGHRGPGRTALLFGTACALLASSWVVALMTLRGWAVAGLRGEPESAGPRVPAPSSIAPRAAADHQS